MINPSKLSNRKLRNPKKPYKKGNIITQSSRYKSRIFSRIKSNPLTKSLISIRKNVFAIHNTLSKLLELDNKNKKIGQKYRLITVRQPNNTGRNSSLVDNLGGIVNRPKTGFLDAIKNFFTFTFLGWLFTKLQPLISKFGDLAPAFTGVMDFFSKVIVGFIDVLAGFIKFGYEAKENFMKGIGIIQNKSLEAKKTFDDATNTISDLLDNTLNVATTFLNVFGEKFEPEKISSVSPNDLIDFSILSKLSKQPITKYESGGRIDPNSPITRDVIKEKPRVLNKPSIIQQKTIPGKDVGGESKIREIYGEEPNKILGATFLRSEYKSGYSGLLRISEEYKKPNNNDILGIGNLMGSTVDISLGQRPDRRTYTQFSDGIKYLVNKGITNPEQFNKVDIEMMIRQSIEPKTEIAINKIRDEINKKSRVVETYGGSNSNDPGTEGGDVSSIDMGGFSPEDIDALGRMIAAESAGESAVGKAGVLAVILNRYRLIKSGVVSPGAFNISGKTREQVTIRDILFAGGKGPGNQFSPYRDGNFDRTSSSSGRAALAQAISAGGNDPEKFKENLMKNYGLNEADADYVVRSVSFSNPSSRGSRPFNTREVSVGRHVFQQSPNARLSGQISRVDATVNTLFASTGAFSIPKADYIKGVVDESGEPGFDVTWRGNNNIAILPGRVKEVGQLYGANYGNVVVVESIDPVTGKKVDVLYSHFPNGGISVRPGQPVNSGQVLGRMGRPGERGIGNITGQHASIDFYQPNSKSRYSRWEGLTRETIRAAQTGKIPKSWESAAVPPKPQLPPPSNTTSARMGEPYLIGGKMYYFDFNNNRVTDQNGNIVEVGKGKNEWILKEAYRLREIRKRQNLSYSPSKKPLSATTNMASYENTNSGAVLAIQPVIVQNTIPVKTESPSKIAFAPPVVNSNNKSEQLMRS